MKEYKLPHKTLLLWRIRTALIFCLLASICAFYSFTMKPFLIALLVLSVVFVLTIFWYLPQLFKAFSIKHSNNAVIIESGFIVKQCHILPFSRLIYTQSVRTPLARLLGLTAFTLKAARNKLFVPEIDATDAKEFIEAISHGDAL
ncbi:MAG: PH domain-containing protein [Ruminococcaceae bacterium]|nr:PH domain-containing protein [Oscillospiraceae bacterium]